MRKESGRVMIYVLLIYELFKISAIYSIKIIQLCSIIVFFSITDENYCIIRLKNIKNHNINNRDFQPSIFNRETLVL